jgi:UrcA family protein
MKVSNHFVDQVRREHSGSKLLLMGACIVFLTAAIVKQLPAQAADASATISLADLDLSTAKGMQTARERLHLAARRLCGKVVNPWGLAPHEDLVRCVDDTTAAALGKIQGPVLVANAAH